MNRLKMGLRAACLVGLGLAVTLPASASVSNTATADATATLIAPITISKTTDFSFGNIIPGASAGLVALSTGGVRSITSGGTVLGNGSGTAAAFGVSGEGTSTFSVGFSSGVTLSDGAGTPHTMTLDTFVLKVGSGSDQTSGYAGTLVAGAATLHVGGTLNVDTAANNPAGSYSTASTGGTALTVTVNYN